MIVTNGPAHAPVGMWIDYGLVNEFLREWCLRKEQLKSGEISEDEYFEWKINWPASSSSVMKKDMTRKIVAINGENNLNAKEILLCKNYFAL